MRRSQTFPSLKRTKYNNGKKDINFTDSGCSCLAKLLEKLDNLALMFNSYTIGNEKQFIRTKYIN